MTASGLLTHSGFGFKTADGSYTNPFYADFLTPPGFLEVFTQPALMRFSELPIQFAAASVPEPSASALVVTALVGLVSVGCSRRAFRSDRTAGPQPD